MSLKSGDLRDLVSSEIHIDEFESKMGKDEDIIVLSFKVRYNAPALDLVNYLEKGYEWVMDADVSSGTVADGEWLVFVETLRRPSFPVKITALLSDLRSLTNIAVEDWRFVYKDSRDPQLVTAENLEAAIPLSPRAYRKKNRPAELDEMVDAAGIKRPLDRTGFSDDVAAFVNLSRYR